MKNISVSIDENLTAEEVIGLRAASGWDADLAEWCDSLSQNLVKVSVRDASGQVLGVGFLTGNIRHAEITDLVVHPDYREQGIGEKILTSLISQAKLKQIKYLGLTYDKNFPWLKEFYEKHGFKSIDFAMWHTDSLTSKG